MEIKQLTKAEEQVMQYLWQLEKGFLKDILEFSEPKPHTNTVSTILKVLKEKGFVNYRVYGRQHEYFPIISQKSTVKNLLGIIKNYFGGGLIKKLFLFSRRKTRCQWKI